VTAIALASIQTSFTLLLYYFLRFTITDFFRY